MSQQTTQTTPGSPAGPEARRGLSALVGWRRVLVLAAVGLVVVSLTRVITGADDIRITATGNYTTNTTSEAGANNDGSLPAAIALAAASNNTIAQFRPGTLQSSIPGDLIVTANHTAVTNTRADAAIAGRHGDALIALRHALDSGADPVPMVAAFAMKVRTMAKVAGARGAAAGALGLAPWQVDRARRDLIGWTDEGLGTAIQALAAADAAVKGAERDPVFALERLIGIIAARGRVGA